MAARQLKIKVGTLTRTKKELVMYEKEYEKEQEKVKKMMADGADAADLKQQVGRPLLLSGSLQRFVSISDSLIDL